MNIDTTTIDESRHEAAFAPAEPNKQATQADVNALLNELQKEDVEA